MKKSIFLVGFLFVNSFLFSQETSTPFQKGEWLRFKMSYSGWLKAGTASLRLDEAQINNKTTYHVTGKGRTTGLINLFFKVRDNYQSYFDKETGAPYLFKRKINEGGYKKHQNTAFNHQKKTAYFQDFLRKKDSTITIENVQDMLSAFYYLRKYNIDALQPGDEIAVGIFMDKETFPFRLRYLGTEILSTRFGNLKTLKFRPLVQSGRVFKAEESVTLWITADANKIPIKMQANLAVGSLQAELDAYKGLANSFEIIVD